MPTSVTTRLGPPSPIRVLHVITWMDVGGAQDHVLSLASGLDPGRFEVAVATGTSNGALGGLFDPLADAVQVVPLRHLRREISPLHDLLSVREIRRLIKTFRPDILHTHSSKAGVVGRLAAAGTRVKTVHNVHGWTFYATENPFLRRAVIALERGLAAHTDVMLNVSAADAAVGQANGITARVASEVVRGGIDINMFMAARRHDRARPASSGPLIGTVGRLARPKDPVTAVEAMAQVVRCHPNARFRWIGDGPLLGEVRARVSDLGLDEHFELVGNKRDIPTQLNDLDVFVLCSVFEGLPRSLMEAAAAGVPIVATPVGGVAELIQHDVTGLLVEPGNPSALAQAICDVSEHPDQAQQRAAAAELAANDYSIEMMCARTAAVYESLIP